MTAPRYADVALPLPVQDTFTYQIPEEEHENLHVGCRVEVEFGHRVEKGYCVGTKREAGIDPDRIKEIRNILDPEPLVDESILRLSRWLSRYYLCSWGQALEAALPAPVRDSHSTRKQQFVKLKVPPAEARTYLEDLSDHFAARERILDELLHANDPEQPVSDLIERAGTSRSPIKTLEKDGMISIVKQEGGRDSLYDRLPPADPIPENLTDTQENALEHIRSTISEKQFESFLLHGVTGSGKTEVYLRAIRDVIEADRQAIVLLPEISLTPQALARFRNRFARIAVLHSYLSPARRRSEWESIRDGEADIVLGARSAIFAPVPDLGLVVVDEEHDSTYKQDRTPRYHGRDTAVMRASMESAPVILGSATPSLESIHNAREDRYTHLHLPERIGDDPLPDIQVVDMAQWATSGNEGKKPLSKPLIQKTNQVLRSGGQVMLFLNRRGYASFLYCAGCETVLRCESCALAMTYHRQRNRLICHHCSRRTKRPAACPDCNHPQLLQMGMGTERIEKIIRNTFPDRTIRRMDSDTMTSLDLYEDTVSDLQSGDVDILVGTQMIAKGLHFPGVELVGVISADTALHLSDFRAAERTFQLITQIAGRAGRGQQRGTVLLQTFNPDHYSIQTASRYDFRGFVNQELENREILGYPPYQNMLRILTRSKNRKKAREHCEEIAGAIEDLEEEHPEIMGPEPAPMERLRDRYRFHILALLSEPSQGRRIYSAIDGLCSSTTNVDVVPDMDPQSIL